MSTQDSVVFNEEGISILNESGTVFRIDQNGQRLRVYKDGYEFQTITHDKEGNVTIRYIEPPEEKRFVFKWKNGMITTETGISVYAALDKIRKANHNNLDDVESWQEENIIPRKESLL